MERYNKVKDHVYGTYHKINNELLRTAAFLHTNSVDNCITLLAISRNLPVELAKIAALLHDFAQYAQNCPHKDHARLSSLYAHQYLEQSGLFKMREIDEIGYMIGQHSYKNHIDSPMCELLKDADVLARFLEDPYQTFSGAKKERLLNACADLN
ncbi:HD domain-containing protein [Dubosiella muris]|uniref:HD domain-containing protein n=1 Tax=Dubosiella muris TaxID=3038133 RepID=A0AC61RAX5_9FIRM|nr:HD domain-containing protein [Dubosiella muris]TGY66844.1 HD domain-containing protein [Dubosiella muris]